MFGRLEEEDQRLKKHYGRWMDIVRSLELESCIFTKLTKPSVPVILVGPQVSLPLWWVPASRGYSFFLCSKEALPCVRRYSWWVRPVSGGDVFCEIQRPFGGSQLLGGGIIISRVLRRHFLVCGRGPSCQPLHVQSISDGCRSLTKLTTRAAPRAPGRWTTARPTKGTTQGRGRHNSGCPCGGEYEG